MGGATPLTDEQLREAVEARARHDSNAAAASELGLSRETFRDRLKVASKRGLFLDKPVMPGFEITEQTTLYDADGNLLRDTIRQRPEKGGAFNLPAGHVIKGVSALVDSDGRVSSQWIKTAQEAEQREAAFRAVVEGLKDEIPREKPSSGPTHGDSDLLNMYVITDVHMGALADAEETGSADYDLKIAEQLLLDWFEAAIRMSPPAATAILGQLGDLLHYDSHKSITPEHGHLLDGDSRFHKMVRAAIRVMRKVVGMLLEKHRNVHIIIADANHDPASGAWLREMFAAFYEDEPRVTVDSSASTYYCYEFGQTSIYIHHGHRRGVKDVDSVFAGRFREIFGRTKYSYAHLGHKHSDELRSTNLMKVEQHETLAAPDAYAANGGWLSGRSAKVITYHRSWGEVGRVTISADMVRAAA